MQPVTMTSSMLHSEFFSMLAYLKQNMTRFFFFYDLLISLKLLFAFINFDIAIELFISLITSKFYEFSANILIAKI